MSYGAFDQSHPTPPKRRRRWPFVVGAIVLVGILVICLGAMFAGSSDTPPPPVKLVPSTSPGQVVGKSGSTCPAIPDPKECAKAGEELKKAEADAKKALEEAEKIIEKNKNLISGDDLVHVGEDVPPGTYRAESAITSDMCYWKKSKDAEGTDIISNDIPAGGRPQVTLKKGQWFTSQGCPNWILKGKTPPAPVNLLAASSTPLSKKKVYVISQGLSGWPVASAANWLDRYTGSDWVNAKSCPRNAYRCVWVKKDTSLRAPVIAATYGYNTSRVVIKVDTAYAAKKGIKSQAKRKYVIAHELGHAGFLRAHNGSRKNLMYAHVGGYHYGLTASQKSILRKH